MSRLPTIVKSGTNNEDEDPDRDLFTSVPRTIPTANLNFNTSFSRRSTSTNKQHGNTAGPNNGARGTATSFSTTNTTWDRNGSSSLKFEPATPSTQNTRDAAKVHPEEFYSTIEDEEEEEVQKERGFSKLEDYDEDDNEDDGEDEDEDEDGYENEGDKLHFRSRNKAKANAPQLEVHGPDHFGKLETKPKTDNQDTLWTEIDALDDVKTLAQTIDLYEGFPIGFEDHLQKIRESHTLVLRAMRDRNARIEEEKRHEITSKADSQSSNGLANTVSRINTNATVGPEKRINQDSMGPTVMPEEDKYIQELIATIKDLRG